MIGIFLSFAEENSAIAGTLAEAMKSSAVEVFSFQDKENQGKNFIKMIEDRINTADLFVAVMSPDYTKSYWCRKERELAMTRESGMARQFIYVCQVARTRFEDTGFGGTIAWLDLMPPVNEDKIRDVVAALALPQERPASVSTAEDGTPQPLFHNRTQEVNRVVDSLTTMGGHDFWLVVAPPRMGKSWFLERVAYQVRQRWSELHRSGDRTRLVDLRAYPEELRSDWIRLLYVLFDVPLPPSTDSFGPDDETTIVVEVGKRSCAQIYLLDSAELMTPECVGGFRLKLSSIYDRIRRAGNKKTRVGVVVASRQLGEWPSCGKTGKSKQCETMALAEFDVTVVRQAVNELDRDFGRSQLEEWAQGLHQLSEGLPALLVASLRWANGRDFAAIHECAQDTTFETVARPYIREDLLADRSLLPSGDFSASRKNVLNTALQAITAYRLFTFSHLKYLLAGNDGFEQELVDARWTMDDLWDALRRTALLKQPALEVWGVLSPPIRRLLYRYYYSDITSRKKAHDTAREFYPHWADRVSDSDQCVALLEYLWHEAMAMRYQEPARLSQLPNKAVELTRRLVRPASYSRQELIEFVRKRMSNDIEFSKLVSADNEQLFGEVLDSIEATISGGSG